LNLSTLASLAADYGLPFTASVVLLYILVRGEFVFRYPSRHGQPRNRPKAEGMTKKAR
jgi:hypothetical protein